MTYPETKYSIYHDNLGWRLVKSYDVATSDMAEVLSSYSYYVQKSGGQLSPDILEYVYGRWRFKGASKKEEDEFYDIMDEQLIDELEDADEAVGVLTEDAPEFHPGTVDNPFLYEASIFQLEKFLLTNVFVAGKNATIQQQKLDQFVECVRRDLGSYAVDTLGVISAIYAGVTTENLKPTIMEWLKEAKVGQYNRISTCIEALAGVVGTGNINLKNTTRKALVSIKGIGLKTASMFMMYTHRNWGGAVLDTHILKFLRDELKLENVPDSTPTTGQAYFLLERAFIAYANENNKKVADLDFEIWSKYRKKVEN
jgi:thermostable 8-oxoguanine DNA glycosylase